MLAVAGQAWSQGFVQSVITNDVSHVFGVAAADFDGDGDLDVAASGAYGTLAWIETTPNNNLTHAAFYSPVGLRGLAVGDFNGDGRPDIVVAVYGEDRFALLTNTGQGTDNRFAASTLMGGCHGAYGACAGDINHDGTTDLVTSESLGNTVRMFTQHNGVLEQAAAINVPNNPFDLALGDFDGDGDVDIVGCRNYSTVFWIEHGANDSTWTRHDLDFGTECTDVALADLDSSGTLDIVAAPFVESQFAWWQHSGTVFTQHNLSGTVRYPRGIGVADFDLDGRPDIVACAQNGVMQWWRNAGNGTFTLRTMPQGSALYALTISDFDQDGDPDVLTADYQGSQVLLYRNTLGIPAVVAGTVRSLLDNSPVNGALVQIVQTGTSAQTDNAGRFHIAGIPGTYDLRVTGACWTDTLMNNVQIARGETTRVAIEMTQPLLQLDVSSLNVAVHNGVLTPFVLSVRNPGNGMLDISITAHGRYANDDWLSVSPAVAQVPPSQPFSFVVNIHPDTSNSGPWDYYGSLELRNNACPDSIATVAVVAYVLDAPEPRGAIPAKTALHPVYPNPFNGRTTLTFDLSAPGNADLALFDITGRAVRTLSSGTLAAGPYRMPLNADDLPSGVYLLALRAGGETFSQKLLLIK
ncbi:MAG TPA: FG-GAP-like repeat-containing protein [bacterium]|jgi:hypothetical protein